jgi:hypothetical protein
MNHPTYKKTFYFVGVVDTSDALENLKIFRK